MQYAILSDIHANLEALQAVINHAEQNSIDQVICLGDLIGYGPNPNECIEFTQQKANVVIAGNHDHAPLGKVDTSYFNKYAKLAIDWTIQVLKPEYLDYLGQLTLSESISDILFVHATPNRPEDWDYIFTIHDARRQFSLFKEDICFIGHSHSPVLFIESKQRPRYKIQFDTQLTLEQNERYIINVGSVGQPRDSNPRASYAIYDSQTRTYAVHRVEYDIETTQKKNETSGLARFSDYASTGWPIDGQSRLGLFGGSKHEFWQRRQWATDHSFRRNV